MKIIGVIATKNRVELFKRALNSTISQTRKLDNLIIVSDSIEECKREEKVLVSKLNVEFIENIYTHNYAGSLNTAMHHILRKLIFIDENYEDLYIAFLDDDDIWLDTYLEECEKSLKGEDFVVSGLTYCNENGKMNLSIPKHLTIDSFLKGNPHIQGSNTFVKFSTLLKAGLFDENMSSTTDRDIFTRIMLLNPSYTILPKYLVEVDAFNTRSRITNGKEKKADGLRKFYYKYNGYMSKSIKNAFFERAENLFKVMRNDIENIPSILNDSIGKRFSDNKYKGNLVIGFIVTEYELGLRLLQQLVALKRKNTQIIIFINFIENRLPYINLLNASEYTYEIIDRKRVLSRMEGGVFDQFVTAEKLKNEIITDIAVTRTILQKYLYEFTKDGDVIWVLDEDMELKELILSKGEKKETFVDIDKIISKYHNTFDAVVGNYALDAPLPTLSIIRTSLLDYVYNRTGVLNKICTLQDLTDYYYDLTDNGNLHLETPFKINDKVTIDRVFSGKAAGRPLVIFSDEIKEVKSRGGNTLIFNRDMLKIPNWSIQVGNKIGRRSDYFWVWQAKQKGYKIANVPFATLHNRNFGVFNMVKEEEKLLADFIGSSFTKAIDLVGMSSKKDDFFQKYKENFIVRLVKYIASYYRINGLLTIIKDKKYIELFTIENLIYFLRRAELYLQYDSVITAYETLQRKLYIQNEMFEEQKIKQSLELYFSLSKDSLCLLGNGSEGVVFTDKKYVYKYFFKAINNLCFLQEINKKFSKCNQLYSLDFFKINETIVIRYPYEESKPYTGGHIREFVEFLRFAKENGFGCDNYKKENFIVARGTLKLIDYGKSFLPFSEEIHKKSVTRVFQMLRYPFLNENEFKQLIRRSYLNETIYIDSGKEILESVIEKRYKEDLHDGKVIDLINSNTAKRILDYGAGKCKIANKLSNFFQVEVFDIDMDTINSRALSRVKVIRKSEDIPSESYDVVLSNLVLCCVENQVAESIVEDMVRAVKMNGQAIISICNPFFNNIQNTELRMNGITGDYHTAEIFSKRMLLGDKKRKEYHRPIEYYLNLFERHGLKIEKISEGDGVNMDTLLPIAEHLIFVCRKISNHIKYKDCSLLIKTNPMEHRTIYKNIKHIVKTLEKGVSFEKRMVVVDLTPVKNRARRYEPDNTEYLKTEVERAKNNGLIDAVLYAKEDEKEMLNIYNKYFGLESLDGHSENGQGLYATLMGFDSIITKYVFQTDSDILYYNNSLKSFIEGLNFLRKGAVTVSLGIAAMENKNAEYGTRTEVRTCFLNLKKLSMKLPLHNNIKNGKLQFPWHRALDECLQGNDSVRLKSKDAWFIHPENNKKQELNFVSYVEKQIEQGIVIKQQYNNVNLQGDKTIWTKTTNAEVIIYIRGFNTSCEKLKRMFESIKKQTFQNFMIIYVDDSSTTESADYAEFIFNYDSYFKNKCIYFFNDRNVGEINNFIFIMQAVITNKNAIIINLDNDDYFVNENAIEIIVNEFNNGAEITCGNCIRYDKPLKKYKIYSFDKVWERGGDNIWLHPKCFRRYLFDYINFDKDLKIDDKIVEVNTDFAIMLPMIRHAKKKVFIKDVLYYFEPSFYNINKKGKYSESYKMQIKEKLLQKEKTLYEQKK